MRYMVAIAGICLFALIECGGLARAQVAAVTMQHQDLSKTGLDRISSAELCAEIKRRGGHCDAHEHVNNGTASTPNDNLLALDECT